MGRLPRHPGRISRLFKDVVASDSANSDPAAVLTLRVFEERRSRTQSGEDRRSRITSYLFPITPTPLRPSGGGRQASENSPIFGQGPAISRVASSRVDAVREKLDSRPSMPTRAGDLLVIFFQFYQLRRFSIANALPPPATPAPPHGWTSALAEGRCLPPGREPSSRTERAAPGRVTHGSLCRCPPRRTRPADKLQGALRRRSGPIEKAAGTTS